MDIESGKWRYTVKTSDPEEAQSAMKELLDDEDEPLTMMDIEDEYDCTVKGLLKCADGKRTEFVSCDDPVHIDFKEKKIRLPKASREVYELSDEIIPATRIRYVGLPTHGNDLPRNYGDVAVLSVWNADRAINNIYFLCEEAKSTMLLLNSITRLVYETFDANVTRTQKFYRLSEGPVDVAFCSTDDREKRDILKQKKEADKILRESDASSGGDEQPEEEMPELVRSPMYFVFDEESILLFEHAFSFRPLHDFRFFREETELSIDTIYVCNVEDQLEFQKTENVFFLYPQKDHERSLNAYKQLVEILREGKIRPKSQNVFKGTGKEYEDFYNSPPEADAKDDEDEDSVSEDEMGDLDDQRPLNTQPDASRQQPAGRSAPAPSRPSARAGGSASTLLGNLNTGSHLLSSGIPEDMQFTWFAKENEIEKVVRENKTTSADVFSAGLDPQSSEHLQTAVEDIRNKLMKDEFGPAVSSWRSVAKVYGKTLLAPSSSVNEVEMLKRIFFLSG